MKEVEVKARVRNLTTLKKKLQTLGCKFAKPLKQKDIIYIHRSEKFTAFKRGRVALRLRDANGKYTFTLKKQLNSELDNIEKEIIINDLSQAQDILKNINFVE